MFDLFYTKNDALHNLLPEDGIVNYYGCVLTQISATNYFQVLLETIEWKNDVAYLFGKRIETKRKVAWYGDELYPYTYSNSTKYALPWTKELLELKKVVEEKTGETYNACLLNLYHSGAEGMTWHSDAERELKRNGAIASMSLGAERNFAFKHKTNGTKCSVLLHNGSLLVMKGETQKYWLHRLPPTTKVKLARINLTFRTIERR